MQFGTDGPQTARKGDGSMKRLLFSSALLALLVCSASAHQGMLALFADPLGGSCNANIGACEPVPIYLVYIRGSGPEISNGMSFRLVKSTTGAAFLEPQWPGEHIAYGGLETGIDVVVRAGEGWCLGDNDMAYMGTISVINYADPDTFTVRVAENPFYSNIVVTLCQPSYPQYDRVKGGTFVFNGKCHSPEDPFGENVAVENLTWGSIKELFR